MLQVGPLKLKPQFLCGDERAFGPGRAALLQAIQDQGSISAAARTLGMSYRYTWLMVSSMNRCFQEKLVETSAGAGRASGARLTAAGAAILSAYRSFEKAIGAAVAKDPGFQAIAAQLRDAPADG